MLLGLGHDDSQDAVVERSLDVVVVDAAREGEGAREVADAALVDPILVLGLLGLGSIVLVLGLSGLGDRGVLLATLLLLVFHGGLELLVGVCLGGVIVVRLVGDGAAHGVAGVPEKTGGRVALGMGALDVAADDDRLRVAEVDLHVLLVDTGELPMELVVGLRLLHVEARSEGRDLAATLAGLGLAIAAVVGLPEGLVPVVDEADQATEVAQVVVVVVGGVEGVVSEDGHFVSGCRVVD